MKITSLLLDLQDGMKLDQKRADELCSSILDSSINSHQIAAVLSLLSSRALAVSEVLGFREAIKNKGLNVDLGVKDAIDLCGTGGDGKHTFNISTAASFIVAALGYPVIKHGNYAVSSKSGSSDILQALGYEFSTQKDKLQRDLEKANICFLHAPLFYPILKNVGPIRKDLGIKTIFNVLGPLLNPANVECALTGVYDLAALRVYSQILPQIMKRFYVVHTLDGYDEISLTAPTRIVGTNSYQEENPAQGYFLGVKVPKIIEENLGLKEIDPKESFINFLQGKANQDLNLVVSMNAALAICTVTNINFVEAQGKTMEAINAGYAFKVLEKLVGK